MAGRGSSRLLVFPARGLGGLGGQMGRGGETEAFGVAIEL